MNIIYCEDYSEMSRKAAAVIASQMILRPKSVLGFATGLTPVGMYKNLVECYEREEISFSKIKAFTLDEYLGVEKQAKTSFFGFMQKHLFSQVDINPKNIDTPDGAAEDILAECDRYTEELDLISGGIDFQVLGIGVNGHIGFNEPDDHFPLDTHVISLTQESIDGQKPFFDDVSKIPTQGITMGIRSIMMAKQILLLASGEGKADILEKALFGPVMPQVPASMLQFHAGLTVVADCDALKVILKKHPGVII